MSSGYDSLAPPFITWLWLRTPRGSLILTVSAMAPTLVVTIRQKAAMSATKLSLSCPDRGSACDLAMMCFLSFFPYLHKERSKLNNFGYCSDLYALHLN